uniref:Arginine kinase n=1 Tax=Chromera velia CCMP2878 TaxID=1169474 RepID=A0A0G4FGF7_9ALVE|eukprot:Cvel_16857.t1-p1 / transcript=Cvel_16857.t1 / gene=Cvel_16857 / organism=Chromera_velia_CCMP2878 / gene_product=Arginine kinase, putative / transcript_product=Arginine kinase, putative / location=Cvel_scaffold1318:15958-19471(-) / protein_length=426 / sequence_SO=supercontig / SO=protein_coding / is_pseudo=false
MGNCSSNKTMEAAKAGGMPDPSALAAQAAAAVPNVPSIDVKAMAELAKAAPSILAKIEAAKHLNPDNLMAKYWDLGYFTSQNQLKQLGLLQIVRSGAENPDSGMGMYAMQPTDYDDFKKYFDECIKAYHKISGEVKHVSSWELKDAEDAEGIPADGKLDVRNIGIPDDQPLSMRVRVGRNLSTFPLPGAMTQDDRVKMEQKMIGVFEELIKDHNYGGTYHSLTPGNKYSIDDNKYNELVKAHIMFKDMSADHYLMSAGIAKHWPHGRGCYVAEDKGFIVWVGEEDHLRIMCMKTSFILNDVFDRLRAALDRVEKLLVESKVGEFARSPSYGYVTSCPTNLGTGMRASVHVKLPKLTADGTDKKAKAVAKPLGLSVRGLGGEHTPIGEDGTVDISPSARLMIKEATIICKLYKGLQLLREEEAKVEE